MTDQNEKFDRFEENLRLAVGMPEPDPTFVTRLSKQMNSRPMPVAEEKRNPWWKRRFVPIGACLLLLLFAFLFAGPQKVVSAIQNWLSAYIPAFGYVEDVNSVRMITEPVREERDGGVMTVDAAFTDSTRTIIVIGESHTPGTCSKPGDQIEEPYLSAGDTRLDPEGWMASRLIFPALPADVDDVTLHMPWMQFCETDESDWEIPLHFEPAPKDVVMPVLDGDMQMQSSATSSTSLTDVPAGSASSVRINGEGTLELGQVTTLKDGVLISGLLRHEGDDTWFELPSNDEISIVDAEQKSMRFEALLPEEVWTMYADLPANSIPWGYRVTTGKLPDELSINIPYLLRTINPEEQPSFELDLGSDPQSGQTWTPNLTIPFEGHALKLVEVRLMDDAGKVLAFEFETDDQVEFISVADAESTDGSGGGGTGESETQPGKVSTTCYFNESVVTGKHLFKIVAIQDRVVGPWQLTWQAP